MSEYPPLTSVEEYPLHSWNYGHEYACQRPEDPHCQVYDWRCNACVLAAQAELKNFGDAAVIWQQDGTSPEQPVMLSWLIERSIFWANQ